MQACLLTGMNSRFRGLINPAEHSSAFGCRVRRSPQKIEGLIINSFDELRQRHGFADEVALDDVTS